MFYSQSHVFHVVLIILNLMSQHVSIFEIVTYVPTLWNITPQLPENLGRRNDGLDVFSQMEIFSQL